MDKESNKIGPVWKKHPVRAFMEYHENGRCVYANNFKVKPFGGFTLGLKEKSLRIVCDSNIGPKSIKISPFLNKRHASYKSLVLRTSGSDQRNTRIKDIMMASIARELDVDYQDYRQAVLFVNGEYWGIYNIREKINKEYLKYNHGASKNEGQTTLLELGGMENPEYREMVRYIGKNFPDSSVFDSINAKMDVENYLHYLLMQIHIQNIDSRGNVRFWKSKSLDNRWRWIFFDADLSCGHSWVKTNYLQKRLSPTQTDWYNPTWSTVILRNLVSHKPLRNFFINKYCLLLGGKFHPDSIRNRIAYFAGNIRAEIPFHVNRRDRIYGETASGWELELSYLQRFFDRRYENALSHVKECFSLNQDPVSIEIKTNFPSLQTIRLAHSRFPLNKINGFFFPEIPLEIEAVENHHLYTFLQWSDGIKHKFRSINPSAGYRLSAVYQHKKYSKMHKALRVVHMGFMQSKKDSFYLVGIENASENEIRKVNLLMQKNGLAEKLILPVKSLEPGKRIYFTNKPKIAKAKFLVDKSIDTPLIPGFSLRGGEWVLSDELGEIVDSAYVVVADSLVQLKKNIEIHRDLLSGKWLPGKPPVSKSEKKRFAIQAMNWKLYVLIAGGFLLFCIAFLIFRKRIFFLFIGILFSERISAQEADRFGLDSAHTKLVNNKGNGHPSLSGLRNVRVVLKNLLYRGGNNNPLSVQNPLTDATLDSLHKLKFDQVFYLYNKNFTKYFSDGKLDSLRQKGLNYRCSPSLSKEFLRSFLEEVYMRAQKRSDSLMYIHCWNGWHQSGWLSAISLMQFCSFSNDLALAYWKQNTDFNHNGYHHVKEGILTFRPYEDLGFSEDQKKAHCPCFLRKDSSSSELPEIGKHLIEKPKVEGKKNTHQKAESKPGTYMVKKGDTLSGIAKSYNTTVEAICRKSGIKAGHLLKVGSVLKIR
jgi:hypothetical protein